MLCALQYRAISLGYVGLFGETLKSNVAMKDTARKAGFEFSRSSDWRAIRFDKRLDGLIALPQPGSRRNDRREPEVRFADQLTP